VVCSAGEFAGTLLVGSYLGFPPHQSVSINSPEPSRVKPQFQNLRIGQADEVPLVLPKAVLGILANKVKISRVLNRALTVFIVQNKVRFFI